MNQRPTPEPAETPFAAECQAAVDIAEEAGTLLRSRFPRPFRIHPKGEDGDVVTELDLLAEDLVTRRLAEHLPDDRIVAEEDPGILTWLIAGDKDLASPQRVQTATNAYAETEDHVGRFLAEACRTARSMRAEQARQRLGW